MSEFSQFTVGQKTTRSFDITPDAIDRYAELTGDRNPLHMDAEFAREAGFRGRVAHGMYLAGLVSKVIGEDLPGYGSLWFAQDFTFDEPVYVGDVVEITVEIEHVSSGTRTLGVTVRGVDQNGVLKFKGRGKVSMPEIQKKKEVGERLALVTGGSGGIGSAICESLAASGIYVLVGYAHNSERAEEVTKRIRENGGNAAAVRIDLSDEKAIARGAELIAGQYGAVDTVVCAAMQEWRRKPFEETSVSEFKADFEVSVVGHAQLLKLLMPGMCERSFGRVIGISSVVVHGVPPSQQVSYVTAKYAMVGMFRALMAEYSGKGITFNLVSPSFVDTPLTRDLPERTRKAMMIQSPMRRLCTPADVAAAVSLLAAEDSFINGATIPVTGGSAV
ncbi:MAG: SDR family oxidoreductase [Kiritimatiellia bacterium]|nr:SDR family oxidoreductase [Kiritimatiellia bacterium]MDP7023775.1 SDR family oxidoreductase [Kiritimatiellia bacterium]